MDAAGNVDATPASRTWTCGGHHRAGYDDRVGSVRHGRLDLGELRVHLERDRLHLPVLARLDHRLHGLQLAKGLLGPRPRKPHLPRPRDRRRRQRGRHARQPHVDDRGRRHHGPRHHDRGGPVGHLPVRLGRLRVAPPLRRARASSAGWTAAPSPPAARTPTFHVANGRHQLEVRAVDAAGNADASPATPHLVGGRTAPERQLRDALDRVDHPGRRLRGAGLEVEPRHALARGRRQAGPQAGRVTATAAGSLSMNASPWPINSTAAGTTYTVRGSIRSETPGKTVCLRVREWDAGAVVGSAQQCLATTAAWREFATLQYTALRGGSELELLRLPDGHGGRRATASSSTASRSATDRRPRCRRRPRPRATRAARRRRRGLLLVERRRVRLAPARHAARHDRHPGDTEQNHGYAAEFERLLRPELGPPQGAHQARRRAITSTARPRRSGYFDYFGSAAGERGKGWYSYDLGAWHIVVLNSNCDEVGGCGPGLRAAPVAPAGPCGERRAAAWAPTGTIRASAPAATHGNMTNWQPFWELLYQHGAEWVLGGNDHNYQRFAPQAPDGTLDRARGMRQFVVGEGGTMHYRSAPRSRTPRSRTRAPSGCSSLTLHGPELRLALHGPGRQELHGQRRTDCSPLGRPRAARHDDRLRAVRLHRGHRRLVRLLREPSRSTFECSLDGAAFGALLLAEGAHRPRGGRAHLPRPRSGRGRHRRQPRQPQLDRDRAGPTAPEPDPERDFETVKTAGTRTGSP